MSSEASLQRRQNTKGEEYLYTMKPLFIDLDGTLLFNDSVQETFTRLLLKKPWLAIMAVWILLMQGRVKFKTYLTKKVPLKNIHWPLNPEAVSLIQKEKARGRKVILLTATHEKIAHSIVDKLHLFDQVEGSTDTRNFKGKEKLAWIREHFPNEGFLYAGNSTDDVVLWEAADEIILVNPSRAAKRQIAHKTNQPDVLTRKIQNNPGILQSLKKMLRIHQYSKNLLIFVPLLLSGKIFHSSGLFGNALLAWISFSATASLSYIVNDLLDLDHDRMHSSKKHRPLAAGALNTSYGFLGIFVLFLIAFLSALALPLSFAIVLLAYFVITLAYSFFLKRMAIIDVFVLSVLYLVRIIAGGVATGVSVTYWLFVFALFFFLSLAYLKRFIEIDSLTEHHVQGRNYDKEDLMLVKISGLSLGFLSVLIFTLYLNSTASMMIYKHPSGLWLISILLLYWINDMWHAAVHRKIDSDPIKFALQDRSSLVVSALIVITVLVCQGWLG